MLLGIDRLRHAVRRRRAASLHRSRSGLAGTGLAARGRAGRAPTGASALLAFLDPWADPLNTGYQTIQSLIALGSGGWFGVGLGASRQKWSYIPNSHTDFIFAILGEEMGLLGTFDGARPVRVHRLPRASGSPAGARSLRDAHRVRDNDLDRRPGSRQHRRGHRDAAHHRRPAAARLVRRHVARRLARGDGDPYEHRSQGKAAPRPRSKASRPTRDEGRDRRRRHGRAREPGPRSRSVHSTATRSCSSAPTRGAESTTGPERPDSRSRRSRFVASISAKPAPCPRPDGSRFERSAALARCLKRAAARCRRRDGRLRQPARVSRCGSTLRIPVVLHEQNIVFGLANKVGPSHRAQDRGVVRRDLGRGRTKGVFTGNPVSERDRRRRSRGRTLETASSDSDLDPGSQDPARLRRKPRREER